MELNQLLQATLCQGTESLKYEIQNYAVPRDIKNIAMVSDQMPISEDTLYLADGPITKDFISENHYAVVYINDEIPHISEHGEHMLMCHIIGDITTDRLYRLLNSTLLAQYQRQSEQVNLMERLNLATDFHQIIPDGSRLVGCPLIYADIRKSELIMLPDYQTNDRDWRRIQKSRAFDFQRLFRDMPEQKDAIPYSRRIPETNLRFVYLYLYGTIRGILLALSPEDFDEATEQHFQMVARTCEMIYMRDTQMMSAKQPNLNAFISTLLEGARFSEDVLTSRLGASGWTMKGTMHILVIGLPEDDPYLAFRVFSQQIPMEESDQIFFYNNTMVLFTDRTVDPMNPMAAFAELRVFLKKKHIHAGIGRPFTSMRYVREHYIQGMKALTLGQQLGHTQTIYQYDDYTLYHLFEFCPDPKLLLDYCHPAVLRLVQFDQENGTDFLGTLKLYINVHASAQRTAEHLFVHKNTVIYRVNKALQIMNMDLDNSNHLMEILLSMRILEYIGNIDENEANGPS